jgi:hypothetical protein
MYGEERYEHDEGDEEDEKAATDLRDIAEEEGRTKGIG